MLIKRINIWKLLGLDSYVVWLRYCPLVIDVFYHGRFISMLINSIEICSPYSVAEWLERWAE